MMLKFTNFDEIERELSCTPPGSPDVPSKAEIEILKKRAERASKLNEVKWIPAGSCQKVPGLLNPDPKQFDEWMKLTGALGTYTSVLKGEGVDTLDDVLEEWEKKEVMVALGLYMIPHSDARWKPKSKEISEKSHTTRDILKLLVTHGFFRIEDLAAKVYVLALALPKTGTTDIDKDFTDLGRCGASFDFWPEFKDRIPFFALAMPSWQEFKWWIVHLNLLWNATGGDISEVQRTELLHLAKTLVLSEEKSQKSQVQDEAAAPPQLYFAQEQQPSPPQPPPAPSDSRGIVCFTCGGVGHKSFQCRRNAGNQNGNRNGNRRNNKRPRSGRGNDNKRRKKEDSADAKN